MTKFIVFELFKDEPPINMKDLYSHGIMSVSNSYKSAEAWVKRMTTAKYQPTKKYIIVEVELKQIMVLHTDITLRTTEITNSNLLG